VYIYGQPDQQLGFRLISLVERDWSAVHPVLWRVIDGTLPRTEADASILNCGGGQYVAVLSAGDTTGDYISYQLEAENCISNEKTILPFRSAALPFSVVVDNNPPTTGPFTATELQFQGATGIQAIDQSLLT
jgi:hypothetical protein